MAAIAGGVLGAMVLVVVIAFLVVIAVFVSHHGRKKESGMLSLHNSSMHTIYM